MTLAAAVGVLSLAATASSARPGGDGGGASRFHRLDPALLQQARDNASKWLPASLSSKPIDVMLQFGDAPVAAQDARSKAQGHGALSKEQKASLRGQLKSRQGQARNEIEARGGHVLYQLADAYDGVIVHTEMKDVGALAQVPGVVAVHPLRQVEPANTNGVPYIGGNAVWGGGYTGAGIKIGVIDTGIDYTHADFGGLGTTEAWAYAQAHSTENPAGDSELAAQFGPTAPKVKGGTDLVGDDYDADPASPTYQPIPHPDPNPLDCYGHGTHTAGTAAGYGVLADGSTYTGPYGSSTIGSNSWNVGPGVAPDATIYAYRVFGCVGPSDLVAAGIDQAVADGVNVISLSVGSVFGDSSDPSAVAAQSAVDDGITVVAASGNEGPSAYTTGSPASANGVLSVAAVDGSVPEYPGATITTGVDLLDANGADLPSGSFPVKVLTNPDGSIALGCSPDDYAGTAGDIVITMRGTCARVARAIFGEQAGAAAVVMVNTDNSYPPYEGRITSNPDTGESYTVTIPFLGAKLSQADALKALDGTDVTLGATTVTNTNYGKMAGFSSGGPRNLDSSLKPEVTAPGVSVASAGMGTGTAASVMSGTSMATPMTSGAAALLMQAHPGWSPAQVKAALIDTASDTPSTLSGYNVRLAGAGVVQVDQAVTTAAMATTLDGLDTLSYGYEAADGAWSSTKHFQLHNESASSVTYDLSADGNGSQLGSSISMPSTVTVPAGGTEDVAVTLSLSAAAVAALPSVDTFAIGPGALTTIRGNIVASPESAGDGIMTLHVPYLAVPRGTSDLSASLSDLTPTGPTSFGGTISLANGGIHTGTADLYTWGIHDAQDVGGSRVTMDVRDVGVQSFPLDEAGSDYLMVFAVNDYTPVTNQSANEYDIAIIRKGHVTGYVVGVDLGAVLAGDFDGIFASFTLDAAGNIIDAFYADSPMNGSTVLLPTVASELGIDASHSTFRYGVTGFSLTTGAVDSTGTATYDPFTPGLSSGDFTSLDPGASDSLDVSADQSALKAQDELGWLVVSLDSGAGAANALELPLGALNGQGPCNGQGQGQGNGQGNGNGNGNGQGNGPGQCSSQGSAQGQGQSKGQSKGKGQSQGQGQGHSQGQSQGKGHDQGQGNANGQTQGKGNAQGSAGKGQGNGKARAKS